MLLGFTVARLALHPRGALVCDLFAQNCSLHMPLSSLISWSFLSHARSRGTTTNSSNFPFEIASCKNSRLFQSILWKHVCTLYPRRFSEFSILSPHILWYSPVGVGGVLRDRHVCANSTTHVRPCTGRGFLTSRPPVRGYRYKSCSRRSLIANARFTSTCRLSGLVHIARFEWWNLRSSSCSFIPRVRAGITSRRLFLVWACCPGSDVQSVVCVCALPWVVSVGVCSIAAVQQGFVSSVFHGKQSWQVLQVPKQRPDCNCSCIVIQSLSCIVVVLRSTYSLLTTSDCVSSRPNVVAWYRLIYMITCSRLSKKIPIEIIPNRRLYFDS